MKRAATILLFSFFFYSCTDKVQQQAKVETIPETQEAMLAQQEANKAVFLKDSLTGVERNNIIKHLIDYCPLTYTIKHTPPGGFEPGMVFIENKTGYTIGKLVVRFDFVKSSGSVFDSQLIEFNDLMNGNFQSKPTRPEVRGSRIRTAYVSIVANELTYGQEITRNDLYGPGNPFMHTYP